MRLVWVAAAATARADSHRFVFDEAAFIGALDAASWHMDQPIGHPNSLALWLLAHRSREHATVLLSGEGADELFGGYARFSDEHEWKFKWMLRTQKAVPRVPPRILAAALRGMERKSFVDWSFGHYLAIAPPEFAGAPSRQRAADPLVAAAA